MKKSVWIILICFVISGCVVGSENPFYTPDLVVDKAELYGEWFFDESRGPQENSTLVLSPGKLTLYDDTGAPADAQLTFFQVEGVLFADIFPEKGLIKTELVGDSPPVHLISLVKYVDGKLFLNPMNYDWVAKEVENGNIKLPYQKTESDSDILFTATSSQWLEFLKVHLNDPKAFPPETEGWLTRKTSQEIKSP
jgi:hypothetical protein